MFSQQLVQPTVLRYVMCLCIPFKLIKEKKVLCDVINHCREWPEVFPEESFLSVFKNESGQIQKAFTLTAILQRCVRSSVLGWLALVCIRKVKLWRKVLCSSPCAAQGCCWHGGMLLACLPLLAVEGQRASALGMEPCLIGAVVATHMLAL